MPIYSDVPLHCINEAAVEFHIPARLIISILQTEHGKNGSLSKNKNGTYDIGSAQINSSWLPELKKYGLTQQMIQFNPCVNVKVSAWILAKYIASEHNLLTGVGSYNSHTKKYNQSYYQKVQVNFTKIHLLLD